MAVSQDNIGQLRKRIEGITIRLASDPHRGYGAEIIRQAPEATNQLPSTALATIGGGKFIPNPDSRDELLSLQKVFLVDLGFDQMPQNFRLGTRAYVRIDHGGEPLARQWMRRIRQIFLRQFNV
jgi:putative peptide zinc metalloprotease protein